MKFRSVLLVVMVAAVSVLSACGVSVPIKKDSQVLTGIRTLAIVKVPEPFEYSVINRGSAATAFVGGAIGGAMMALDAQKDQKGLLGALARARFSFADQLTADLKKSLGAAGYAVKVIEVPRGNPAKFLDDHAKLMTEGADAVLDVAVTSVGYSTEHWMFSPFWRPEAWLKVGLYSKAGGEPVYAQTLMYGYHNPLATAIDLDAPAAYRFDSKEAMEAAGDNILIGGLKDASQAIAAKVAEQLAR